MQLGYIAGACCCALFLGTSGIAASSLSHADRQFMVMAANVDMNEAHEGQMAETQATRSDVRDLARTVVDDHTKAYGQLGELAAKTGATIPRGIDTAKEKEITALVHLKGDRFDRQFVRDEVANHRRAIAMFKREAAHGQDADVRTFAAQRIPVLEKHLQMAEKCATPAKRS